MENVFLSTESLTKQYRGHAANNCVTVSIPRGKITGFIGKNGSGKTTLIRMLTGLAFPTSGKIEFCDADARKHIGAIVEAPAFFGGMSAKDNVVYQAKQCGVDPSNALSVLDVVGLDKNNRKKVRNYSLGMRQRLGIANALLCDPEFLILDEPTNGLDPQGMIEMRDLLHRLSRSVSVRRIWKKDFPRESPLPSSGIRPTPRTTRQNASPPEDVLLMIFQGTNAFFTDLSTIELRQVISAVLMLRASEPRTDILRTISSVRWGRNETFA